MNSFSAYNIMMTDEGQPKLAAVGHPDVSEDRQRYWSPELFKKHEYTRVRNKASKIGQIITVYLRRAIFGLLVFLFGRFHHLVVFHIHLLIFKILKTI